MRDFAMKFGKLLDISAVDFGLPPLSASQQQLPGRDASGRLKVYVGCPRWASKDWIGQIYPPRTQPADYLRYYAQSFQGIELNSTHYRPPTPELVQKWAQATGEGFRFSPKIPQRISHHQQLRHCHVELQHFTNALRYFGPKLGHSFVQLHDSFGPSMLHHIAEFLTQWPSDLPLAIEFRHPGWFAAHRLITEAEDLLRQHHVAAVITDVAGRRDVLHQSLPTPTLMLRLVGNGLHPSDYARIDAWMERLKEWVQAGLDTIYFFAHEPGDVQAVKLAAYAIEQFNQHWGLELPRPHVPQRAGDQMSLF